VPELDPYVLVLYLGGLALLGSAVLPRLLADAPLAYPPLYVGAAWAVVAVVPQLTAPDPLEGLELVEHLTELGVIVSLMGAGLRIDRPFGWRAWSTTWRLLAITMPLSIGLSALLGWWALGFAPATALLLGAVLAPTDPVLASDVQVAPPRKSERRHEVRFGLTSEAGFNDALAFPFTNAAIALAAAGGGLGWVGGWLAVDVAYKLVVGLVGGLVIGRLFAILAFRGEEASKLANHREGFVALSATLVAYAGTELVGGYGFLAVFVAACVMRGSEEDHEYHEVLHDFAEQTERLAAVAILLGFGAALSGGLLDALTPPAVGVALALVLLVRPLTGYVALLGTDLRPAQRAATAFFGIRGIGSMYYLAHALAEQEFPQAEELVALCALVIMISLVLHGVTASPAMRRLDALAEEAGEPVPGST
jgi:NhaP-type Na+/H+ or K+/H+ antiporter